ncbi:hypothetical protein C8Q74DRAFT_1380240 [Fomes fomentarius]|nr:hypothetical protein C8Q74DRAFT_1380240 [Fomes fomentarius]
MDACRAHDWRMLDVLVAIWLDMCPDVVLCQRLLERGLLKKVLQLINTRVDPSRVLRLLSVLALHGDALVKQEVIRRGRRVLDAIHAHRNNMFAAEFGIVALSHALEATYLQSGHQPFDFKDLLSAVLTLSTNLLCDPHPSHNLVLHTIPILIHGVELLPRGHLQQITPQLEFFAALTRSTNISLRCASLVVFQTLNPKKVNIHRPQRPPFSVESHQIPPSSVVRWRTTASSGAKLGSSNVSRILLSSPFTTLSKIGICTSLESRWLSTSLSLRISTARKTTLISHTRAPLTPPGRSTCQLQPRSFANVEMRFISTWRTYSTLNMYSQG